MNRLILSVTIAVALLATRTNAQNYNSQQPDDPVVTGLVKIADHVKLPARESGVLTHLAVKEGSAVRAGQPIAKIDDREIQQQLKVAEYAARAAAKRYQDDVDIRYAEAGAAAAEADFQVMKGANTIADRAITEVELRAAELNWKKMVLAAEKARKEQELAFLEAHGKKSEYELTKVGLDRRSIIAPFDGIVEELARKQDEWVNPGDPILRLFRMDTMQVEGAVEQKLYDPHELQGCKVTVEVQMARGRKETVEGHITKVSSTIGHHGFYNVRAEVPNRQEHGSWMLRDGLPATMRIHLGTGGNAAAQARQ